MAKYTLEENVYSGKHNIECDEKGNLNLSNILSSNEAYILNRRIELINR